MITVRLQCLLEGGLVLVFHGRLHQLGEELHD
jgi:hypothetical protein